MDSRQMQHENAGNNRLSVLRLCKLLEPVPRDQERTYINNVWSWRGEEEGKSKGITLCIFMNYR